MNKPKSKVLVTAAKSNTSLAVISALQNYDVEVYAMTSSTNYSDILKTMGVKEIILVDLKQNDFLDNLQIRGIMNNIGTFDAVIDPFFDIYLPRITELMSFNSSYVTCGFYEQYTPFMKKPFIHRGNDFKRLIMNVMAKNISIIGNCIGQREDGIKAIQDYKDGKFQILIDKVFSEGCEKDFFDLTYNSKERLGKVVYMYKDQ